MIANLLRSTFSVVALLLLVDACTEQKITTTPKEVAPELSTQQTGQAATTLSAFNKSVGSQIDRATALQWMANFAKANSNASVTEHYIQADVFKRIISNSTCVGVSLQYSFDDSGQLHIIPIGIDGNGKKIVNLGIDIGDFTIDWQTQQRWIANYTGKVRSHFFGAHTFTRLLVAQVQIVRITLALDDEGNPQLLLSDASSAEPSSYEDKSYPCPPVCSN
jgi:hypothetical protein